MLPVSPEIGKSTRTSAIIVIEFHPMLPQKKWTPLLLTAFCSHLLPTSAKRLAKPYA
jgi:hypothetical protein